MHRQDTTPGWDAGVGVTTPTLSPGSGGQTEVALRWRLEYTGSRRGSWTLQSGPRYDYDRMWVIQERDANNIPKVSYTRGRDLSGSMEGAGGIGGLLARTDMPSLLNSQSSSACYHADGNGNVTSMINTNQMILAKYLYDPYGNTLSASGPLAEANLYRFSSKELHPNSGLVYYLYRFYDGDSQRWLNRDPLGEQGGVNLYEYVRNQGFNAIDPFGQDSITLGILGCLRAGNDLATCVCVFAPDSEECEQKLGDCVNALQGVIPNPGTGAPGRLPTTKEMGKCACDVLNQGNEQAKDLCKKAVDNLPDPKCKKKPKKPLPDISIPNPPPKTKPPAQPPHRQK